MKILKIILIISPLLLLCNLSQAQRIGFKLGGNFAQLSGENAKQDLNLKGLHVGAMGGIYLKIGAKMLYLEPGVYYSEKGYRIEFLGDISNVGLSYVELPVLLNVKLPIGLGFYAGPAVGYMVNVFLDGESISPGDTFFDELDLSAMGGIKYHLPFGLNFGAGASLGLLEVLSPYKNFAIQAFVGFTLPGAK